MSKETSMFELLNERMEKEYNDYKKSLNEEK